MNSSHLKGALVGYFRFKRGYHYVSTECGLYASDVLVSDGQKLIEIEVKTSRADLKRDIQKRKHRFYKNAEQYNTHTGWIPNEFYVAVPLPLKDVAIEFVSQWNDAYGVICFDDDAGFLDGMSVAKRAKKLHKNVVSAKVLEGLTSRMSSELAGFWQWSVYYRDMVEDFKGVMSKFMERPDLLKELEKLDETSST